MKLPIKPSKALPKKASSSRGRRQTYNLVMRLRIIARLASAERDGSLYLACGCASLAGAVAVIVSPSHIPTSTERAQNDLAKLQAKNEALKATLRALKTPLSKDDLARLVEVAVAKAYEAEQEQRSSSIREGDLMAQAPLLPATAGILSQSVMLDPKPTVTELRDNGLCRIDACLTPGVAATLLAHVNTSLADARSRVAVDGKQRDQDTFYKALKEAQPPPKVAGLWPRLERLATSARTFATHTVAPEVELESFGAVLAPTERWDLKLLLTPPVVAALREVLGPLQAVCETMLGKDAVLFECAALVADPHAPRQPIHPDTAYQQSAAGPLILTVFVALQVPAAPPMLRQLKQHARCNHPSRLARLDCAPH